MKQVRDARVLQRKTEKEQLRLNTNLKKLTPATGCHQDSCINAWRFLLLVIRRVENSDVLSSLLISFYEQLQTH